MNKVICIRPADGRMAEKRMPVDSLDTYMEAVRELVEDKGFSTHPDHFPEMIARIHSEISEAFDAWKKGLDVIDSGIELIDAVIYILHLLSILNLSPHDLFIGKMRVNWERPHKYNTKRGG